MGPATPTDLPDFLESGLLRIVDTADDDADLAPAINRLIAAHPDQSVAIRGWMRCVLVLTADLAGTSRSSSWRRRADGTCRTSSTPGAPCRSTGRWRRSSTPPTAGHVLLLLICGARIVGVHRDFPAGRLYLRIALAELPGITVAIAILWHVEFGLDAAGWPGALLWLAPVVTLAWVFLAGAPLARPRPARPTLRHLGHGEVSRRPTRQQWRWRGKRRRGSP